MAKHLFIFLFIVTTLSSVSAQTSVEKLFLSMPNDLLWIEQSQRSEIVAYYKDKKVDSIQNGMNGYCRLLDCDETTGFLSLNSSAKGNMELKIFNDGSNPFIGVIFSICAPACDSKITFYSTDWKQITASLPDISANDFISGTISSENRVLANVLLTPLFIRYNFDKETNSLIATCNAEQFLSENDWQQLKPLLQSTSIRLSYQNNRWIRQK